MLKRLSVRNLAIVERAEAEFAPGLNVITGETGAGKSVLMGALALVLGSRADASVVRDGAKEAEVEADFGDHVVRRTVTAEGRSRAWLDEESVTIAELKDFGRGRVDVHGPRANQDLLEERFQRETLDLFGGVDRTAYAAAYARWTEASARLADLRARLAGGSVADELDMLRYQVNELQEANVTSDDDDLAERHAAAAHAEEIVATATEITEALGGDGGAGDILARLQPKFAAAARHFPAASEWAAAAEDLAVRVQELSRTVADAVSRLDADPEALEELDRRLTLVNRLKRKYGDPVAALEKKRARLDELEHGAEREAQLADAVAAAERDARAAGADLTARRRAAAAKFAKKVTAELHDLGFLQAKLGVTLAPADPEAHGCDRVAYLFEPNPGESARPLASIASSGEIARVMLALKGVLSEHEGAGTLVFDEIDANVGGEIGSVVGAKMRAVAEGRQVIAITHLPQSAVWGARHLVVAKGVSGGRTRTRISEVRGEDRIAEVARMLGGGKPSEIVREHAQELLDGISG